MARVRWTPSAQRDLYRLLVWLERHREPEYVGRTVEAIDAAISQAAKRPELYAWVGSVHPKLAVLPRDVRRVLTSNRRQVIYYRYVQPANEIQILLIRGGAQLPPSPDELTDERRPPE